MVGAPSATLYEVDSRYGWLVVAVASSTMFVTWGLLFTFTVYSQAVVTAFDLSRVAASMVFSTGVLCFFLFGGGIGLLTARTPVRYVVAGASAVALVSLGVFQVATSFGSLAVVFGGLGAAFGTVFVSILALVPQWFDRYEGLAMGITLSANGCGVLVLPFVWLSLLDAVSFRLAFTLIGSVVAILLAAATIIFRRPHDPRAGDQNNTGFDMMWARRLLYRRESWFAILGIGLMFNWYFVFSDQLVDMLVGVNIPRAVAALAFGLIGGVAVVSNVVSGAIADRFSLRGTFLGGGILVAWALFLLVFRINLGVMYLAIILLGIGHGAVTALYAPMALKAFGTIRAKGIIGLLIVPQGVFGFLSPPIVAHVSPFVGYDRVLISLALVTVVGATAFWRGTRERAR